jgi:cell division protein FtsQ
VFTNFPSGTRVLSNADSSLLMDIKNVSLAIQEDPFCMAMIEQVDINAQRAFEMIPKIGNQVIIFGDGSDINEKLEKIKLFYKEVMVKAGWNRYSIINVQYRNQVVAKKKGAEDILADSMRTLQIMQMIVERTQKQMNDSLQIIQQDNARNTVDSSMVQQSIQREESAQPSNTFEEPKPQVGPDDQPVSKPANTVAADKPAVKPPVKPVQKPPPLKTQTKQQPKAVMPKKNN